MTARLSGGVALLIKKEKSVLVKQIHVELDNCVVLKLSSDLINGLGYGQCVHWDVSASFTKPILY